jgi:trigger factor
MAGLAARFSMSVVAPCRGGERRRLLALAQIEGSKHSLDITIPASAFDAEKEKALAKIQSRAQLKGFRPGKVPAGVVRARFAADITQEALDKLIPEYIEKACEKEGLKVVSRPEVKDLHVHEGEDVRFKAEFEVHPDFELGEVRGLKVAYAEPVVTDTDVDERIAALRESKAEFVNVDPRPAQDGDHCLCQMESIAGVEGEAVRQDDVNIEIGGAETFKEFSDALRGAQPGDAVEAEVTYPDNYAAEKLAGRTVRFRIHLKQIRLRELPELNDEFAQDLGDFKDMDEVREEVRKALFREREQQAQNEAKNALVEQLVNAHEFPVPEVYIDNQVEGIVRGQLGLLAEQGVDLKKLKLDWSALRKSNYDRAVRDVKASLILGKIAERESIWATKDEVDAEIQRAARQLREPVAAVRKKFEQDGTISRIASRIRTDKVLNFLFEHAVKEAPPAE